MSNYSNFTSASKAQDSDEEEGSYNNFTPSGATAEEYGQCSVSRTRSTKKNSRLNAEVGMSRLAQGVNSSFRKKTDWSNPNAVTDVTGKRQVDRDWEFDPANLSDLKEIGQGNFGVVFVGFAKNIIPGQEKTKVAVKTLSVNNTDLQKEFMKEATIMKAIDSKHNIVHLLGLCTKKSPFYMIMEFMPRGDLKGVLRKARPKPNKPSVLTYQRLTAMGADIAEGMSYLASIKIVHRDLAARNVLVAEDYTCKIGDFGLTRDVYQREYYRMHGSAPLPIRWMAPESLGDGVFSSSSDLWSFGVVLWELVTFAKTPYDDMNNMEVAEKVVEEDYRMPCPKNCPPPLYAVMERCWQEDVDKRGTFKDAFAKLKDLVPKLSDKPIIVAPEGVDTAGADYAMPQDSILGNALAIVNDDDSASDGDDEEKPPSSAGGSPAKPVNPELYDIATQDDPLYDMSGLDPLYDISDHDLINPVKAAAKSAAAASAAAAAKPQFTVSAAAGAAPASPSTLKAIKVQDKLGANEGAAEFARRTSQDLAGLRNDTSQTAAKVSQASQASATAAYADIADWLERVTGASLKSQPLEQGLKSGDVLCAAMFKIKPDLMPKYHKGAKLAFKQMENVGLFLDACRSYGVSDTELFITIDLFEAANMKQVLACLRALRTKAEANGFKA